MSAAPDAPLMRRLVPPVAAVAMYALLLDAVVETFLSGSAVQWWLAALVLAFGAATALSWRRAGWPARAAGGALALLGLLAFAAWRPEGMEAGPRLLAQETSVILSLVTASAVALSGLALARAPFLHRRLRIALAILAAYGVLAFAWGLRRGSSYTDMLSGAGMPGPLPFWLHGAVLGALVVIPAALLLVVVGAATSEPAHASHGWKAQAGALLLVLAMASAGVSGGVGPGGVLTEAAAAPVDDVAPVAATAAPAPPRSAGDVAAAHDALEERLAGLRSLYESTPRPATTPAGIAAALGGDAAAILAFVAEAVRYEPYAGVLRGPQGVLAAGGGSSADIALLLHDMLGGGSRTRFALTTLSEAEAEALVDRAMAAPPSRPALLFPAGSVADTALPAGLAPVPEDALRAESASAEAALVRARGHVEQLERALPRGGSGTARGAAIAAARRHAWLEMELGGEWVAMDPTGVGGRAGADVERFATLPPEWHHRVHAALEVERLTEEGLVRETLVEQAWETRALEGRGIEVVVVPSGLTIDAMLEAGGTLLPLVAGFDRFSASLAAAGGEASGAAFDLTGHVPSASTSPLGGIGAVDPFARFARPGQAAAAPPTDRLAGVWLTLTLTGPDGPPRVVERALLDRVGPAARAGSRPRIRAEWVDSTAVRLALSQRHRILVALGPVGSDRLAEDALAVLVQGDALQRALSIRLGETAPSQSAIDAAEVPEMPHELIAVADGALHAAEGEVAGGGIAYLAEPNVLILSEGLTGGADGDVGLRAGVDLALSRLVVLAAEDGAARARLLHGALLSETEREALAAPGAVVSSAAGALAAAGRQRVPLRLLREPGDLRQVDATADARAVMEAELRSGNVLLATSRPVADAGTIRSAWWRIDPEGNAVAVGEDGRGQASMEGMSVLSDISIPSVKRTMKFTACLNKAVGGGGGLNESAAACMSQAIQDVVKASLDKAISSYVSGPLKSGAKTQMMGEEYKKLYDKAEEAWERFNSVREAGSGATGAGREIGGAFGFRMYLMLTMGSDIAEYASKL